MLNPLAYHAGAAYAQLPGGQAISFNNALVDAADQGNTEALISLIKQGNPIESRGDFGVTPLMRASFRGHANIVETLINLGADTDAVDFGGASALHLATRQGQVNVVTLLLKADSAPDSPDSEGWTPLMRASVAKKSDIITALLKKGANPKKVNKSGDNAMIYAAKSGDPSSLQAFITHGVVAQLTEREKKNLQNIAMSKGNKDMASMVVVNPHPTPAMATVSPQTVSVAPMTNVLAKKSSKFSLEVKKAAPVVIVQPKPLPVMQKPLPVAGEQKVIAEETMPKMLPEKGGSRLWAAIINPFKNIRVTGPSGVTPSKTISTSKRNFSAAALQESRTASAPQQDMTPQAVNMPVTLPEPSAASQRVVTIPAKTTPSQSVELRLPPALPQPVEKKREVTLLAPQAAASLPPKVVQPLPQPVVYIHKELLQAAAPSTPLLKANKPVADVAPSIKEPQVVVAEAIRVPLSSRYKAPAAVPVPSPAPYSPSNSRNLKNKVWLEVGGFTNEPQAIAFMEQKQALPEFQGLRFRIITSIDTQITGASVHLGPVSDAQDVTDWCKLLIQGDLTCTVVRDFGKSFTLNKMPGNLTTAVKPQNRKNPVFKNAEQYWLQFGSFESEGAAENRMASLKDLYSQRMQHVSFYISVPKNGSNNTPKFRLRAGAFKTYEMASTECNVLMKAGASCIVVQE